MLFENMKFNLIMFAALLSQATAASTGASACPAGEAAPGGPHLAAIPWFFGTLTKGEYIVHVGGKPVTYGKPMEVPLDFDITVTAQGTEFKGILIRVGGTTGDQVTSTDLTAPAEACGDVGSVTHSDASPKTAGMAFVSLDESATLEVDISVVAANSAGFSAFYYSRFTLNAVAGLIIAPQEKGGGAEEEETADVLSTDRQATTSVEAPASGAIAIGGIAAKLVGVVALLL